MGARFEKTTLLNSVVVFKNFKNGIQNRPQLNCNVLILYIINCKIEKSIHPRNQRNKLLSTVYLVHSDIIRRYPEFSSARISEKKSSEFFIIQSIRIEI